MPDSLAQIAPAHLSTSRSTPLRNQFAWTLSGNVLYAACQWGLVVILAKLGSAEMLGQFSLGLAVCAPVFMLTNLQLRALVSTDARDTYSLGQFIALRLLGTSLGLILIAGITYLAGLQRATAAVVIFVSLAKAAETFSDILYGSWQKTERFDCVAWALGGRGIGSLLLMAVLLLLTHSVLIATAAMALYWFVWFGAYEYRVARKIVVGISLQGSLWPQWHSNQMGRLFRLSLPLGFVAVLASLNVNLPRYFVEHFLGERLLGYFTAAACIPLAGATVALALSQSAGPRLARYYVNSRQAFFSLLTRMLALAGLLGGAGYLAALYVGPPALSFLYMPAYTKYSEIFAWLMLAGAFNCVLTILTGAMTCAGIFRAQLGVFLLATVTVSAACYVLVPRFGLIGAAYAVLSGAVVSCAAAAGVCAWSWRSAAYGLNAQGTGPLQI